MFPSQSHSFLAGILIYAEMLICHYAVSRSLEAEHPIVVNSFVWSVPGNFGGFERSGFSASRAVWPVVLCWFLGMSCWTRRVGRA